MGWGVVVLMGTFVRTYGTHVFAMDGYVELYKVITSGLRYT